MLKREEEVVENGVEKRYRVPEGYLESEGVRRLRERVWQPGRTRWLLMKYMRNW